MELDTEFKKTVLKRLDKIDTNVESLLRFKWQVIGVALCLAFLVSAAEVVVLAINK